MKTIGLIGGMSWESTLEYYKIINERVKERVGGLHSAKCVVFSFDFEEIEELQHQGNWGKLTELMVDAARRLEKIGAELVLICTNTMHKTADDVQSAIGIPLIHIMDVTAERIKEKGLKRVGLLGTRFTMEEDFYKKRLTEKHGIDVVVPNEEEKELIHNVIYNELCLGIIKLESKTRFKEIIRSLVFKRSRGNHPWVYRNTSPDEAGGC